MPIESTPFGRRLALVALAAPVLQACAGPLPPVSAAATTDAARALLATSAAAHGAAGFAAIDDISVSYAGEWRALVGRIQPVLVDAGFRGQSEERLLLRAGIVSQAHRGPEGDKQVVRQTAPAGPGTIRVWFNGAETAERDQRDAAAAVVDAYSLFLLGPLLLAGGWATDRALTMEVAGAERIEVGGISHDCDVLRLRLAPGFGFSAAEQVELLIDRGERMMRRLRFTLDGLRSTQGTVAEVDFSAHVTQHGVRWPTRFAERLLRPLPIAVHDWRLTGLDLNRGLAAVDLAGPMFAGRAAVPAAALV